MKAVTKHAAMDDDNDRLPVTVMNFYTSCSKEWPSLGIVQVVYVLIIFMAGVVLGLTGSAHLMQYLTHDELFQQPHPLVRDSCRPGLGSGDCQGLESLIRPPSRQVHNMSDDELLWRASMVPMKEECPFERKPKVAFMFLTKGSLPLLPLWEEFFRRHRKELYSIYVHTPPGYELDVSVTSPFYDRQIPSQEVEWGAINMVDGERRLLANALLDFSNERFVLLSESCIPVYDFARVYDYLINSEHSFVQSYDDPSGNGRGRYRWGMRPDIKLSQWRKGSQWFEINRRVAIKIVSDTKYLSIFRMHCKPPCYPDEHYVPTYLNMFSGSLNSNRSLTWVDWSKGGPHPAKYEGVNITENFISLIRNNGTNCVYNNKLTSVCYLFARKFAPSALEPLLNLTSSLMRF
ncbi:glycosyltransferase BC10-like [Nymphaea colorata]|nr:glycosyltransferase BC10-like [Nymphaea colorata]XP_049934729.1 glycosyltransferase BC10-like [Nymphaea colorata]